MIIVNVYAVIRWINEAEEVVVLTLDTRAMRLVEARKCDVPLHTYHAPRISENDDRVRACSLPPLRSTYYVHVYYALCSSVMLSAVPGTTRVLVHPNA